MIALGNDVVDLTEKPRNGETYYRRLSSYAFIPEELAQFSFERPLSVQLAIAWSIKEAAYKSIVKLEGKVDFIPTEFRIRLINELFAAVRTEISYRSTALVSESIISETYVHTITYLKSDSNGVVTGIGQSETDHQSQSERVRQLALQSMTDADGFGKNTEGIPFFEKDGEPLQNELSFSHHGHVVAFAYQP